MSTWLMERTSRALDGGTRRVAASWSRSRSAGSAVVLAPLRYLLQPGTAYAVVCGDCGGGACCDGYSEFCCVPLRRQRLSARHVLRWMVEGGRVGLLRGPGPVLRRLSRRVPQVRLRQRQPLLRAAPAWTAPAVARAATTARTAARTSATASATSTSRAPVPSPAGWRRARRPTSGTTRARPSAPPTRTPSPTTAGCLAEPPWKSWEPLGGQLTSAPAVASWGRDRLDVFVRGTDDQIWHKWFDGIGWLAGNHSARRRRASAGLRRDLRARSSLDRAEPRRPVRAESRDALWQKAWDGQRWSAWQSRGGDLTGPPGVSSWGPGRIDAFGRGQSGELVHACVRRRQLVGLGAARRSDHRTSGRRLVGARSHRRLRARHRQRHVAQVVRPRVVGLGAARGSADRRPRRGVDGPQPTRRVRPRHRRRHVAQVVGRRLMVRMGPAGGVLRDDPAAVSWGPGRIDVFVRGTDNQLWHRWRE